MKSKSLGERNDASRWTTSSATVQLLQRFAFSFAWLMETPSDFTVGLEFIFTASPCKHCFPPPPECLESFSGMY